MNKAVVSFDVMKPIIVSYEAFERLAEVAGVVLVPASAALGCVSRKSLLALARAGRVERREPEQTGGIALLLIKL